MLKKILKSKILKIVILLILIIVGLSYYVNPYRETIGWDKVETSLLYEQEIDKSLAVDDLNYLVDKITMHHVSTAKGVTGEIQKQLEYEINNMNDIPRVVDVWIAASRIANKLNDAHANIYYYGHKNMEIDLNFTFDDSSLKVIGGPRDGQELIAIEGIKLEELYQRFLSQFSYENEYFAKYNFVNYLRRKNQLNWLGINVNEEVEIVFSNNGREEVEKYLFNEIKESNYLDNDFISYKLDKEKGVGILTLNSCIYSDEYKIKLRGFFSEVKKHNINIIAIDLRENGGGNSMVANEFIKYLPVENYKNYGSKVRLRSSVIERKPKETKNKQYKDLIFSGDVYLLTSNTTFSSATMFTAYIRDNNLGKVIGEPSGNKPSAYGDILLFQLPNSKLPVTLTYKYFSRPDVEKDEEVAIIPDYPVSQEDAIDELYRLINN